MMAVMGSMNMCLKYVDHTMVILMIMYISVILSFYHSNKNMMNKEEANELKDKVQA